MKRIFQKPFLPWLRFISTPKSRRFLLFSLPFLISCTVSFCAEQVWEHLLVGETPSPLTSFVTNVGSIYQRIVTSGPRRTYARYVATVSIAEGREPDSVSFSNVCTQRAFLAKLVTKIVNSSPSVVALDKYFRPSPCPDEPAATAAFVQSIAYAGRVGVPVVIGVVADSEGRLEPSLSFDELGDSRPLLGLLNVTSDIRRPALLFALQKPKNTFPTFARLVALAHDPALFSDNSRLKDMAESETSPYIGFLPANGFSNHTYSAIELLCGADANIKTDWRHCDARRSDRRLRGRIVVIGEDTPRADQFDTVVGRVPGFVLEANYIEALLDERVFRPLPPWVNYLAGFVIFVVFEVSLLVDSVTMASFAAIVTLALSLVVCDLLVLYLGVYFNPVGVGLLAIGIKIFGKVLERMKGTPPTIPPPQTPQQEVELV